MDRGNLGPHETAEEPMELSGGIQVSVMAQHSEHQQVSNNTKLAQEMREDQAKEPAPNVMVHIACNLHLFYQQALLPCQTSPSLYIDLLVQVRSCMCV